MFIFVLWLQTKLPADGITNLSCLPPLTFGDSFEEAYQVILILDDREQFATKGYVDHLIFPLLSYELLMKVFLFTQITIQEDS